MYPRPGAIAGRPSEEEKLALDKEMEAIDKEVNTNDELTLGQKIDLMVKGIRLSEKQCGDHNGMLMHVAYNITLATLNEFAKGPADLCLLKGGIENGLKEFDDAHDDGPKIGIIKLGLEDLLGNLQH
jgi:hypothetical protein